MEPYNKNKPTVSWKEAPKDKSELLERLQEAGIPFTAALKYFYDNPEGPASETLNIATDETVPFKYQVRSGEATPSSVIQEALMLAMPTPKGSRNVVNDVNRSNIFNDRLRDIARIERNNGSNYTANTLDDWANRDMTLDDYKQFEEWSNPNTPWDFAVEGLQKDPYIQSNLKDIILTKGDPNNPLIDQANVGFAVNKSGLPSRGYTTRLEELSPYIDMDYEHNSVPVLNQILENYKKHGLGVDDMINDLIDQWSPETMGKYSIGNAPSSYRFTVEGLENARKDIDKSQISKDVNNTLGEGNRYSNNANDIKIFNYSNSFKNPSQILKDFADINDALSDPKLSKKDKFNIIKSAYEDMEIERALDGLE